MDWVLTTIGLSILAVYFVRRVYWLGKANYHNFETNKEEVAAESLEKGHDVISWVLLACGGGLLLWSFA